MLDNTKAWATIGTVFMVLASVISIVVAAVLAMSDQIATTFAVDVTQYGLLAAGVATGLYAIGKGLFSLGAGLAAGKLPEPPTIINPPGDGGGTEVVPPAEPPPGA